MIPADKPENEKDRLQKLRDLGVLDTEAEKCFDRITRIVAKTIGVPISLVSLVDEDRQWFKSKYGIDASETPRDVAFCAHAILEEEVFVVNDPEGDERFHDNPLVTEGPEIRFYAGAPLITSDGYKLGTLCAIDDVRHYISDEHKLLLQDLASLVIDEIELRNSNRSLQAELEALKKAEPKKAAE
ncbi:MAG: GAF domain-containing protein [Rhodospirillaceae bacterium]